MRDALLRPVDRHTLVYPSARSAFDQDLTHALNALAEVHDLLSQLADRLDALDPGRTCNLSLQANWLGLTSQCIETLSAKAGPPTSGKSGTPAISAVQTALGDILDGKRFADLARHRQSVGELLHHLPDALLRLYGQMMSLSISSFAGRLRDIIRELQPALGTPSQSADLELPLAA